MKKFAKNALVFTFSLMILFSNAGMVCAKAKKESLTDNITPKTVIAGALSLLVWPGIGQAVNNERSEKVLTHAAIGLLPPFRFWSCYDAVVDRHGGYWKNRI